MSKMLIPACYPGSATRNLRAKSPYEADFPSQTFQSIISAQPERAEVRKLLLQIVCCLASTLTPSVAGFLLITSNKTFFSLLPQPPCRDISFPSHHPLKRAFIIYSFARRSDRPNDGYLGALFNVKSRFGHNNLRQRGLNYMLLMYINDIVPVLLSFQSTA